MMVSVIFNIACCSPVFWTSLWWHFHSLPRVVEKQALLRCSKKSAKLLEPPGRGSPRSTLLWLYLLRQKRLLAKDVAKTSGSTRLKHSTIFQPKIKCNWLYFSLNRLFSQINADLTYLTVAVNGFVERNIFPILGPYTHCHELF